MYVLLLFGYFTYSIACFGRDVVDYKNKAIKFFCVNRALRPNYCDKSSSNDILLNAANLCPLYNRRLQDMTVLVY